MVFLTEKYTHSHTLSNAQEPWSVSASRFVLLPASLLRGSSSVYCGQQLASRPGQKAGWGSKPVYTWVPFQKLLEKSQIVDACKQSAP